MGLNPTAESFTGEVPLPGSIRVTALDCGIIIDVNLSAREPRLFRFLLAGKDRRRVDIAEFLFSSPFPLPTLGEDGREGRLNQDRDWKKYFRGDERIRNESKK
jgi:hypothetical protein